MEDLRNKYKGNRIFIVGNAPSLKNTPLDKIKNEYSFGINRIGMMFKHTTWRPYFFFCATHRTLWSNEYKKDVIKAIEASSISFIGSRIESTIGHNYSNVRYIECLHIGKEFSNPTSDWWYRDISDSKVSIYGQSLFGVMQISVYMGFNPIYILGIDGYKITTGKDDTNHFDPNYELPEHRHTEEWFKDEFPRIENSHRLLNKYTKQMGVDVFDATVIPSTSPYKKIKLEEVL